MNHVVAHQLLASELQTYRDLPFLELRQLIGEHSTRRVRGKDGVDYDLTMIVRWRLHDDGDIRVMGFIGESAWGGPHDTLDDTIVVPNPGQGRLMGVTLKYYRPQCPTRHRSDAQEFSTTTC